MAAHDAAVAAGLIEQSEDLPNDVLIANEDSHATSHALGLGSNVTVIDGIQPWNQIEVTGETLVALFDGTYTGPPVYGIVADAPIVMNVTISEGLVTSAAQVYLP